MKRHFDKPILESPQAQQNKAHYRAMIIRLSHRKTK